MKTYHLWDDLRQKKLTPRQLATIDWEVEQELIASCDQC
jgi:hypothetical protein